VYLSEFYGRKSQKVKSKIPKFPSHLGLLIVLTSEFNTWDCLQIEYDRQLWWHIPVIPAIQEAEGGGFQIQGH
jgi:hypothetical protein